MSTSPENAAADPPFVELRDPELSAFLGWLVPGLGHIYQRRWAKGVLFFVCILGLFVYGAYLGGSQELGWGRVVYVSWEPGNRRLPYLCQIGVGLAAMPAMVQAYRVAHGKQPWFNGFMAPPSPEQGAAANPEQTAHMLHRKLHRFFELGTVYTMIAGLLNILAIYDAYGGPIFTEIRRKSKGEKSKDDKTNDDKSKNKERANDKEPAKK